MAEWSANNSHQRANQVWDRLLGCFGDSLIRKFDETPPQEWIAAINSLNDYQLQQGMRRMLFSGKAHPPALPEFVKLCRTVGHLDDIPDQRPVANLPRIGHDDAFDKWDIAANNRLLSYVLTQGTKHRYFDPPQTRILVALKNRWADLMRESVVDDDVPKADQEAAWIECIRMAEDEIAREKAT